MLGVAAKVGLVIAEAETFDVCGWLRPPLNGLNNHAGANLDPVFRDFPDALVDSEDADRVEIFECMEERDGEELRGPVESDDNRSPPSARSSVYESRGLSSMGGMVSDPDLCMCLPPTDRYEEDRIVPLPEEAKELLLTAGGLTVRERANTSWSNLSASSLDIESPKCSLTGVIVSE
jgi:hypothetical protein